VRLVDRGGQLDLALEADLVVRGDGALLAGADQHVERLAGLQLDRRRDAHLVQPRGDRRDGELAPGALLAVGVVADGDALDLVLALVRLRAGVFRG